MPYAGDDGQRELGARGGKQVGVETGKVGRSPSTTDDDYHIKVVLPGKYPVQGGEYGFFYTIALHQCRKQFRAEEEAAGIVLQLMAEVAISGSRGRRDDGDTLRKWRHFQLLVQGKYTFCGKLVQNLLAAASHVAQSIGGVDVLHGQTVAVQFVEGDRDLH